MNEDTWWKFVSSRIAVQEHHLKQHLADQSAAVSFSLLVIKSLITLNAGAAIAYPTIAEVFWGGVEFSRVVVPIVSSLIGLAFALLTGYLTYRSYTEATWMPLASTKLQVFEIAKSLRIDNEDFRPDEWEELKNQKNELLEKYFAWTNTAGFLSVGCLCVGVISFWFSIMAFDKDHSTEANEFHIDYGGEK